VAVWLGYDNADGKRRTLGGGSTGGHVAVPIFEPVIQAVWAQVAPKTALAPPSPEAKRNLVCKTINAGNGQAASARAGTECLRIDSSGQVVDTQYQLVGRDVYAGQSYGDYYGVSPNPNPFFNRGYQDGYQGGWGGYQGGYQGSYQPYRQPNGGYYYDSYGRLVQRPPAQVYEQRDPRVAPAPQRDRYGRQYQAPRPFWPWRFF
jgi:penicillin-binding protein 1A